jgi:hypothetical protein
VVKVGIKYISLVEHELLTILEFTPGFWCGSCYYICSLMCMFCRSLIVFLYFCLLALVLSLFLQLTNSDYPFCIFNLLLTIYMCVIRRVSYKKNSMLALREHTSSPAVFCGIHVVHLFIFQYYFVLCLSSLCVLCDQCCQCRWIVYQWLPFGFLRVFIPVTF